MASKTRLHAWCSLNSTNATRQRICCRKLRPVTRMQVTGSTLKQTNFDGNLNVERRGEHMVQVESIKPLANAGNLKAFAVVTIADVIRIHDIRVVQQPHQSPWVSMPSRSYERDGQRRWAA